MPLSKIESFEESPTVSLHTKMQQLKAEGKEIISFIAGDPDFNTSDAVKSAVKEALSRNQTHYTDVSGTQELRSAICSKLLKENNLSYSPDEILVSNGAKQILFMLFHVLLEKGDEVILPSPYWNTYAAQVQLNGGKTIEIDNFNSENFEKNITHKTKALVLNSPCNPTGEIIPEEELKKIADIAVKNNIWIISDEVYEYLTYSKPVVSIGSFGKEVFEKTFTVNSVSKSFAMAGFRIGYVAGNKEIINNMKKLQSQISSCPSSISQAASIQALELGKESNMKMKNILQKRSEIVYNLIGTHPKFSMQPTEGTFYAWINIEKCFDENMKSSKDFCESVLEKAQVGVVPGSAFGKSGEGFIRLSFTIEEEKLREGIKKIFSLF